MAHETIRADDPRRDRTELVEVKCSLCGLKTDIDPRDDDLDCPLCTEGLLERS